MTVSYNTSLKNTTLDGIRAVINNGSLKIYSSPRPSSPNDAASGVLLATFTTAFANAAANASISATNAPITTTAVASGAAAWARLEGTSGRNMDLDVSNTSGSGDIKFDTVDFQSGKLVSITNLSVPM